MYKLNASTELTPTIITKLIQGSVATVARYEKLENYFHGITAITSRVMEDAAKPNNKIVNPYSSYITNTLVGYFMGKPVTYSADSSDIETLLATLTANDEQDENASLATDASIYGVAYELLYLNEQGEPQFKKINPKEIIIITDDTLAENLLYAIRYYRVADIDGSNVRTIVNVYSNSDVTTYIGNEQAGNLILQGEPFEHYFAGVPIVEYRNNDYLQGDFESVIPLIDAYDKISSDSINDFEAFCNSYLVLKGVTAEPEDLIAMKERRTLLLDNDAEASWLTKTASETQVTNLISQTEQNIHKFSHCPNMSDANFAANASGVAMRYKIMGTEDLTLIKERKFKKGLQRRLQLLSHILNLKGSNIDWQNITTTFSRNLPVSLSEDMDAIIKLSGIVSHRTQLEEIPFIENVDAEMERLEAEALANPAPNFYNLPELMG